MLSLISAVDEDVIHDSFDSLKSSEDVLHPQLEYLWCRGDSEGKATGNSIYRMAWWMSWVWRCLLPVVFARTHWPRQACWRLSILPVCGGCRPVLARYDSFLRQTGSSAWGYRRCLSSRSCEMLAPWAHTRELALIFSWWSPESMRYSSVFTSCWSDTGTVRAAVTQ